MPQETPAGWYPAAHANDELRYWDGQRWHEGGHDAPTVTGPALYTEQAAPAQPYQATRSAAPRNLAIAALVLGGLAFLTGLIPVLGLLLALAGVTLGVVALIKRQPKGLAVTGLALGSVALLTGVIATTAALAGVGSTSTTAGRVTEVAETTSEATAPAEPAEDTATPAPAAAPATAEPEPEPTPSQASAVVGSIENPAPQPYVAKGFLGGEKYSLTARVVDANANALVSQWNMFNDEAPAGFKYVVVELAMTGIDPDGVEPSLASYDLSLATPEGNRYDSEYVVLGDGMSSMNDGPTLYPASSFTGYTAYVVPEGAQSFLLYDNGEYVAF